MILEHRIETLEKMSSLVTAPIRPLCKEIANRGSWSTPLLSLRVLPLPFKVIISDF